MSYYIMLFYRISYPIIYIYITSHHITSYHITLRDIILLQLTQIDTSYAGSHVRMCADFVVLDIDHPPGDAAPRSANMLGTFLGDFLW